MEDLPVDTFERIQSAAHLHIQQYEDRVGVSREPDQYREDEDVLACKLALLLLRARKEAPGIPLAEFTSQVFDVLPPALRRDSFGTHSSFKEWVLDEIIEKLLEENEQEKLGIAIVRVRGKIEKML